MANNETTTKFKVDISELVGGMQKAKRQIALANAEFKAGTAGMDNWASSADGVGKKIDQLSKTLGAQEDILKNLEEQYELTAKQMGADSKEAENLKIKIENQKASIAKTKKELADFTDTLEKVEEAEKQANRTGKEVTDVLADMDKKAEDAGDGFTVLKGAVATFVGNIATSAVSGIKDLASNIMGLAESTREYRDTMSKLNSAGEEAGYGADYAKKKYTDLYGVLGDETASATAVSNFMAMNAEQSTLDSLLNSSIGIWAKYGDSIPLDGLAESVNETAKVGQITGNLADALNWAGISEDAFNEKLEKCTSEQERQKLIADTLNKTYGDLSSSYQENNKDIIEANKANVSYTDSLAQIGAKAEPIMTTLREGFNLVLQKILELTEGVDFEAISAGISEAFTYFVDTVIPKIVEGLTWIIDNKDTIIAGIVGIGTAFAVFKVVSLITAITNALKGMTVAQMLVTAQQWLMNTALMANPIGLIIALVAGLVAGFIVLWKKCDGFRNFFIKMGEALADAFWDTVEFIKKTFNSVVNWFKNNWKTILLFLVNPFAGAFKILYEKCEGFRNFVDSIVKSIKGFFSNLGSNIKQGAKNIWENLTSGASKAWDGIKSVFSKVGKFFSDTFSKAWSGVKKIFSTGGKIFDGIKDGIVSAFTNIVNSIIKGINKVVSVPFNGINWALRKLRNISIAGMTPFDWISEIDVPEIPQLYRGGVLRKGQVGFLEGDGDEAVVPLEKNTGWLDGVAERIVAKGGLAGGNTQTVNNNYNYEFNQTNNSPKALDRLTIYRQTKNLTNYRLGVN